MFLYSRCSRPLKQNKHSKIEVSPILMNCVITVSHSLITYTLYVTILTGLIISFSIYAETSFSVNVLKFNLSNSKRVHRKYTPDFFFFNNRTFLIVPYSLKWNVPISSDTTTGVSFSVVFFDLQIFHYSEESFRTQILTFCLL